MFKTLWHESIGRLSINFLQWHVTLIAKFTSFDETQHSVTVDVKALEGPLAAHSACSLFHGAGASCLSEDHSGIRDGCDIHFSHLCHSSKKKPEILHPQVIKEAITLPMQSKLWYSASSKDRSATSSKCGSLWFNSSLNYLLLISTVKILFK